MPQAPIRYTKQSLNQYFRQGPSTAFDLSCSYEFLSLGSPQTGAVIKIAARKVAKFTAGAELRKAVNRTK